MGLGVRLWIVDVGFSQCRAILYGVEIGVVAVSCLRQGKQSARLSRRALCAGESPLIPLFFLRLYPAKATSKSAVQ